MESKERRVGRQNHSLVPAPLPRQLLAIVIASLAATMANIVLSLILKGFFGVPFVVPEHFPPPELSPLPASDVVIFSLIFSAGGCLVFLVVANTARRPARLFIGISLSVLVISFLLPLRIPTPPVNMTTKLSLVGMHILGAVVLVPLLIKIGMTREVANE